MIKICIVGAGPAGCIAAANALPNCRVEVFEADRDIGVPTKCGGLISKNGLDELGVRYDECVLNDVNGAEIIHINKEGKFDARFEVKRKDIQAMVINRRKYDESCAAKAKEMGAYIYLFKKFGVVELKRALGIYDYVIGADGAFSTVAKLAKFPEISEWVQCAQTDVKLSINAEKVYVFLSPLIPGFFGWIIPKSEKEARVGLGTNDFSKPSTKYLNDLINIINNNNNLTKISSKNNLFADCIPIKRREKTVKGKIMLVGDAAGQTKATTGGGVYFGGMCAKIAAKVAANGEKTDVYESEWRKKYSVLERHEKMREQYNKTSDGVIYTAVKFGGPVMGKLLSKFGDIDKILG